MSQGELTGSRVPLIGAFRQSTSLLRAVTGGILFFFLWLNVHPALAAAKEIAQGQARSAPPVNPHEHSDAVAAVVRHLKSFEQKAASGKDLGADKAALKSLRTKLADLDRQTFQEFQDAEAQIKKRGISSIALQRHYAAVARFTKESESLQKSLLPLDAPVTTPAAVATAKALRTHLESLPTGRTHQPFDPKKLPSRMLDGKVRLPKLTTQELQQILNPNLKLPRASIKPLPVAARKMEGAASTKQETTLAQYRAISRNAGITEIASAGSMSGLFAMAAITPPGPEFLAPTEDVQITQAIRDLAAQLNNQPVEIFNWVRNNIEFLPSYGSIQGSDMTLLSRRGNAYDTASLLIALLRAANISARYAYGTVQIPADKVMNWLGVELADSAAELMSQGGIPNQMVTSGGKTTAFRLEHVWVEAFVDYESNFGAKHRIGDTWIPLDASFKQYTDSPGMNLRQTVPFDAQALLSDVQANAQVNDAEGWVEGIDEPIVQNALTQYQARLQTYVDGQKPDATVGDVLGQRSVIPRTLDILAGSLPYRLIASGNRYASLPASLRHTLKIEFFASQTDQTHDSPEFTVEKGLPSVAGHRMSLVYEPASEEEKQTLADAFENYQTSFSAYAIHFKPTLRLEGEALATAGASATGTAQFLRVTTTSPFYSRPQDYPLKSGDTMVLVVNAGGVTPSAFDARTQAHDLSDGEDPDFTAEMFYQVGLGFWGEEEAFSQIIGDLDSVISYHMPSHGMAGAPVNVSYRYGVPYRANYQTRILDVKENLITAQHKRDGSRIEFARKRGYIGSYLEAGIYDQSFLMNSGNSISAVTGIQIANQQGIRIYSVTPQNVNAILPQLQVDEFVKADIVAATNAGFEVTVPQRDIAVANFRGAGYIIFDPQSGAGQYLISGGRNGNDSPAPTAVYPLPQAQANAAVGIMLSSTLRDANAKLLVKDGLVVGLAFVGPVPKIATGTAVAVSSAVITAIVLTLLIAAVFFVAVEIKYPRRLSPFKLMKLSRLERAQLNFGTKQIRESKETEDFKPTYGNGVYLAEKDDPAVGPIGCGPNEEDRIRLANAYELPQRGEPVDPSLAEAYIYFEITRDNFYLIEIHSNDRTGAKEYVLMSPLIPGTFYEDGRGRLYIGYGSPFIENVTLCD